VNGAWHSQPPDDKACWSSCRATRSASMRLPHWRAAGLRRAAPQRGHARWRRNEVWIGDSMGEMFAYYAACDVAFIGGSLLDFGSQNLIEPCAVGRRC
jgi:3-deoxy-D-manno-octulosonic-acid transferase